MLRYHCLLHSPVADWGCGDRTGDLGSGEWRRRWRLGGCRMEMTLDTWRLGSGDEVGDLATGEWRRHWRLDGSGMETTIVT